MSKIPVLFEILKERKIKMAELAKAIGVSTGNISDWKSGKSSPSSVKLLEIANYLEVTPEYLTGITDNKNKPAPKYEDELTAEETKWLELFRSVSPERRDLMIELLKLKD